MAPISTGFFNTEYFVDLKPKEEWRPVFHQNKDELIGAMDRELEKMPGVVWNFSQPISDNVEEAVSGVKGELAVKLYGDDLRTLEAKGDQIVSIMGKNQGVQDLGLFRVIGQPNLNYVCRSSGGRPFRYQCSRCSGRDSDGRRRRRRQPGPSERGALRPGRSLSSAISQY